MELDSIIEQTIKRTLEAIGAIHKYITRKEMVDRIGRGAYERGVNKGYLNIIKNGGKTSHIRCLRSEFERYEERILV
jgi:hypothetical protein